MWAVHDVPEGKERAGGVPQWSECSHGVERAMDGCRRPAATATTGASAIDIARRRCGRCGRSGVQEEQLETHGSQAAPATSDCSNSGQWMALDRCITYRKWAREWLREPWASSNRETERETVLLVVIFSTECKTAF